MEAPSNTMPGDTRNQAAEEAMVEAVARDLLPALQSGELSMEDFEQIVVNRLTFPERMREQRQRDSSAAEVDVPTEEIVAILGKGTTHDFGADVEFAATLEALNAVLSGPPSSPERRGRWPRGIVLDADPVATCKIIDNAICIAFASEDAARVWVWKMNYEVFAGEGAQFPYIKNLDFDTFRLPDNLDHLMRYVVGRRFAKNFDGELVLALGADDDVGRYEAGFGRPEDGREPLSTWLARCVKRLKGDLDYVTANYDDLPPGAPRDDVVDTSME